MKADAARAGINLSVVSGFRTMAEQQYLYNLYLQGRGNAERGGDPARPADSDLPAVADGSRLQLFLRRWHPPTLGARSFDPQCHG
jgi:hypothetical protein